MNYDPGDRETRADHFDVPARRVAPAWKKSKLARAYWDVQQKQRKSTNPLVL